MIPTLSQVCSLGCPFGQDIEDYASGHCHSVEIWLTKLEEFVRSKSVQAAQDFLTQQNVTASVGSFQGGLLTNQAALREESWGLFRRRLALCESLQIETLVVVIDLQPPFSADDLAQLRGSLEQAAAEAERHGRRLALEFQGRSVFANNLQTAIALVEEVASPHLGICLDLFHFYVGPSKLTDLALLTRENLLHVQVCDLADVPRELATDADRILPGEGDLPLPAVLDRLRAIRYSRCVSIELMNPQIWQIPPRQFGEIAMTALRKVLGQAEME